MPTKGFYQSVSRFVGNFATTLPPPYRSPEFDLRQRQDRKSMPRVAGGQDKKPL